MKALFQAACGPKFLTFCRGYQNLGSFQDVLRLSILCFVPKAFDIIRRITLKTGAPIIAQRDNPISDAYDTEHIMARKA